MKKRAALARALALEPEVLFLDEPTSGLDPITARAFDELIAFLNRDLGLTVLMVTHDLDTLLSIARRIVVLGARQGAGRRHGRRGHGRRRPVDTIVFLFAPHRAPRRPAWPKRPKPMEPDTRYTVIGAVVLALAGRGHRRLPVAQQHRPRVRTSASTPCTSSSSRSKACRSAPTSTCAASPSAASRSTRSSPTTSTASRCCCASARETPVRENTKASVSRNVLTGIARIKLDTPGVPGPELVGCAQASATRSSPKAPRASTRSPIRPRGWPSRRRRRADQGQRADGTGQPEGLRRAAGQPARPVQRPEQAPGAARQVGRGPRPGPGHGAAIGGPHRASAAAPGRQRRAAGQGGRQHAARCAGRAARADAGHAHARTRPVAQPAGASRRTAPR